ncbi:MFS transporter [Nocardiopsis sp. HUAS JQ3]|uniref:MFS transporter n=1 Tax=Nocardiopsis sp. HUAS JQ3 TaxID=3061629 RepID=UPI0023A9B8D0|nr:MFS transporter [Nocardiopsis sp. HUAS JQ3]WDZ90301.1 MFS transporter [Nocardiopsis sp. HUAS JQ3]
MPVERTAESSLFLRYASFALLGSSADFLFGAVFVTILLGRGADPWLLGLMLGSTNLVALLVEAPSGALGDRYGHRRLLAVGLAVWGAGFVLMGYADGLALTLASMYLWAVGFHLQSGTLVALVVNRIGDRDRPARIARTVRFVQVAGNSGAVLGAASVMVAGTWLPADSLVLVSGAVLVSLALLAPVCFPRSPGQSGRSLTAIVRESAVLVASRRFVPLVALTAASVSGLAALVLAWQPMLAAEHGADVRLNGLVLLLMMAAMAAGSACSRFVGRDRPHVWGPVFAASAGLPLVLAVHGVVPLVAGLMAAEFLLGLAVVLSHVWQQTMFSDANRNTMAAMLGMVGNAVRMLTVLAFGWLWELFGLEWTVTAVVGFGVAAALATVLLSQRFPESTRSVGGADEGEGEGSPDAPELDGTGG